MRAPVAVTRALLLIGAVASTQVGHTQGKLLQDTARFRGATWEVIPLVRLDSSKTNDTLAVRELGRVFWLGPRRLIYEAKLAKGGKWALFGVVDESVRRLAVSGEWFAGPGGARTRILWGSDYRSEPILAGPGALVTGGTTGKGLPNSLFTTDGASWRRIETRDSTITLGGIVAVSLGCSHDLVDFEADGAILLRCFAKQPTLAGIFRLRNATLEAVLLSTDTVAGVGPLTVSGVHWRDWDRVGIGIKRGLREFVPTRGGWIAVVRAESGGKKYQDHVLRRTDTGPVGELWRTELFSKDHEGIGFTAASPAGAVILEYGEVIGVVEAEGTWRPLLTATEIKPPKNGGSALLDVTWLDPRSNRALLSVWPYLWQGDRLYALWPKQYYFDGARITEVRAETGSGLGSGFSNLAPQPVARKVPGYDEGVIVHHPLLFKATSVAAYFDPDRAEFVPAPAFRTQDGDLGLERLLGWNGPNEAVVRWNGIAILRRP